MLLRLLIVVAVLAAAAAGYAWWLRRQGAVRTVDDAEYLSSEDLGAKRGYRATFVQFSTPMCAKCPGTAQLLKGVAADHRHVVHVEVDASVRLDLARRLDIMRTPTTLVLDGDGRVVARMSGPPTDEQAREALATVPAGPDYSI